MISPQEAALLQQLMAGGSLPAELVSSLYGVGGPGYGIETATRAGVDPGHSIDLGFDQLVAGDSLTLNRPGNFNQRLVQGPDGVWTAANDPSEYTDRSFMSGLGNAVSEMASNPGVAGMALATLGGAALNGGFGAPTGSLLTPGSEVAASGWNPLTNAPMVTGGGAGGAAAGAGVAAVPGGMSNAAVAAGGGAAGMLPSLGDVGSWIANNPQLAGAIGGGLLGGISGAQDITNTQTQTTTTTPDDRWLRRSETMLDGVIDYGRGSTPTYTGATGVGVSQNGTDARNAALGLSAAGNTEMSRVRQLLDDASKGYTAAQNAEIARVRELVDIASQGYTAADNQYAYADNPYLQATIDAANRGVVRNYNNVVAPTWKQGSSFGNAGLAMAEANERANVNAQLSDNANTLSYQGYNLAAQLQESLAARRDEASRFGLNASLTGANLLGNFGESYAGRMDSAEANRIAAMLQSGSTLGQLGESAAARADAAAQARASTLATLAGQDTTRGIANMNQDFNIWNAGLADARGRASALISGLGSNPFGSTTTTTTSSTTPGNWASGATGGAIVGSQIGDLFGKKKNTKGLFTA